MRTNPPITKKEGHTVPNAGAAGTRPGLAVLRGRGARLLPPARMPHWCQSAYHGTFQKPPPEPGWPTVSRACPLSGHCAVNSLVREHEPKSRGWMALRPFMPCSDSPALYSRLHAYPDPQHVILSQGLPAAGAGTPYRNQSDPHSESIPWRTGAPSTGQKNRARPVRFSADAKDKRVGGCRRTALDEWGD